MKYLVLALIFLSVYRPSSALAQDADSAAAEDPRDSEIFGSADSDDKSALEEDLFGATNEGVPAPGDESSREDALFGAESSGSDAAPSDSGDRLEALIASREERLARLSLIHI